ncbi:hypothetical protein N9L91_01745 [Pseudomonadales bacterium]|nr:hypothetical protein [Pseudomonadales bacterium]
MTCTTVLAFKYRHVIGVSGFRSSNFLIPSDFLMPGDKVSLY